MGIARDPAEFPEREARDVGKLGGGEEAIDLEAIENRLALKGVSDKKLKTASFRGSFAEQGP
jgi:hypothetical protein